MPQLNMAPTPGSALAVVAATKAASSGAPGAADAAPDAPPAQQFADVLRRQVNQNQSSQTSQQTAAAPEQPETPPIAGGKAVPAELLAALAANTDSAAATPKAAEEVPEPSADAIAAIAPMLAGVVPVAQTAVQQVVTATAPASKTGKDQQQEDVPATGAADLVAGLAALQPAVPATLQPAKAEETAGGFPSALAADKGSIVTDGLAQPATHAAAGKEEPAENFESLLSSATAATAPSGQRDLHAARKETNALPVSTPVGARGWDDEVGTKLTWMAGRQESHAELVLNPPQLGRVEVSLSLKGDQANAIFVSAHPEVREALENALPRLREVLMDAGIALGQAQVGAESFRQSAGNGEKGDNPLRDNGSGQSAVDGVRGSGVDGGQALGLLRRGNGLVDTFA